MPKEKLKGPKRPVKIAEEVHKALGIVSVRTDVHMEVIATRAIAEHLRASENPEEQTVPKTRVAVNCPSCGSTTYAGCEHTTFAVEGKVVPAAEQTSGTHEGVIASGATVERGISDPAEMERRKRHMMLDAVLNSGDQLALAAVNSNLDLFFHHIGGDPEDAFNTCPAPRDPNSPRPPGIGPNKPADEDAHTAQEPNRGAIEKGKRKRRI